MLASRKFKSRHISSMSRPRFSQLVVLFYCAVRMKQFRHRGQSAVEQAPIRGAVRADETRKRRCSTNHPTAASPLHPDQPPVEPSSSPSTSPESTSVTSRLSTLRTKRRRSWSRSRNPVTRCPPNMRLDFDGTSF